MPTRYIKYILVTYWLLDIADVYEDIQKEDKQHGTNRAQALIEELAKSLPEYMETYISEYI